MPKKNNKNAEAHLETTYYALHGWYKKEFELLGWMILAKSHGFGEKIECYKTSLRHLHQAIKNKIAIIECNDKKTDLKLMLKNVDILMKHVDKDFM